MPLYEFECKACGKASEILVRSADWKGTPCPKCGSTQLMKKLSVFAASVPADGGGGACAPCGMPAGGGGGHCCSGGGCCGFGAN